jgi:hypothetical protein
MVNGKSVHNFREGSGEMGDVVRRIREAHPGAQFNVRAGDVGIKRTYLPVRDAVGPGGQSYDYSGYLTVVQGAFGDSSEESSRGAREEEIRRPEFTYQLGAAGEVFRGVALQVTGGMNLGNFNDLMVRSSSVSSPVVGVFVDGAQFNRALRSHSTDLASLTDSLVEAIGFDNDFAASQLVAVLYHPDYCQDHALTQAQRSFDTKGRVKIINISWQSFPALVWQNPFEEYPLSTLAGILGSDFCNYAISVRAENAMYALSTFRRRAGITRFESLIERALENPSCSSPPLPGVQRFFTENRRALEALDAVYQKQ